MTVFLFSIVMVRTLLREAGANLVTSYQLPVTSYQQGFHDWSILEW